MKITLNKNINYKNIKMHDWLKRRKRWGKLSKKLKPKYILCKVSLQTEPKTEKEVATTCTVPIKVSLQSTPLHCRCLAMSVSMGNEVAQCM